MSYKYNGVVLPDINSVWVDKETYPFAFILYYEPADIYEIDLITTKDLKYYRLNSANWYLHSNVYFSYIVYKLSDGLWADGGSSNSYLYGEEFRDHFGNDDWKIIWTSESLYDRYSGQLVLEASDPEPINSPTTIKFPLRDWITGFVLERCNRYAPPAPWITFLSYEPFTIGIKNTKKNWDGTLYYSTDTVTWNEWDGTTAIESAGDSVNQRIYMRGVGNTVITGQTTYDCRWTLTGNEIRCVGNIENLLDYKIVSGGQHPIMGDNCYNRMFYACLSLTQAPELPAITLSEGCYYGMFDSCISLIQAPDLPASILADSCYSWMFACCYGLTIAPRLQANVLEYQCYRYMFYECTSLIYAPELPATTLATGCYDCMFSNCTSLTVIPSLSAVFYPYQCCYAMFYMCSNVKLSTVQSDEYPTEYRIPSSGTGTEENSAFGNMFYRTGGSFTDLPEINTTYYLHKDNGIIGCDSVPVYE